MGEKNGRARRLCRVRERLRRAPLAAAFVAYLVFYLVTATALTLAAVWLLGDAYAQLWDAQMPVHVYNGPYLYDPVRADLVPAASIELGGYSGEATLYLGISQENSAAAAYVGADGPGAGSGSGSGSKAAAGAAQGASAASDTASSREVYATRALLASDPTLSLSDWGGNFTEPYDEDAYERLLEEGGDNISPDALPAYDARQRAERAQVAGELAGLTLAAGTPSSNVAYYVSQDIDFTPGVALLRFAGMAAPLVIYGALAWVVFRRFYRMRLAEPLAALTAAIDKIAAQNLDFTVPAVTGRELGRLAEAFERMRASLAAAQQRLWRTAEERKRLNAAFAHDLRTPLTVLKGTLEMAQLRLDARDAGAKAASAHADGEPGAATSRAGNGATADRAGEQSLPDAVAAAGTAGRAVSGSQPRAAAAGEGVAAACAEADRAAEAQRTLATLNAQVERLQRYAEIMSAAGKLEDRPVNRVRVPLAAFARGLFNEAEALVRSKGEGLALRGEGLLASGVAAREAHAELVLDAGLVAEAVGNLLNNACAHAASCVTLTLTCENDVLACTVADDGPGFTPEALCRGCEPFYSEAKSAEHFGMGLNIARVLAELHGGDVELANAAPPAHGARVTARFACGEQDAL